MPKGVTCSVANCSYWAEGNNCAADEIKVEIDQHASANFNEEFSSDHLGLYHQDHAEQSAATCCQTFKAKE